MSIYIPQLVDYIPQIQPFRPDFNFYAGALQMKQGQYDTSYKKLSSVYGTLLNSPMLRDSNIARRDQFFRDADAQIKKISGLDLSRQENVDAAMAIFKPFYDDKQLVKDMTWTRQYQNELTRADNFRNCVDPKKCGGQYWEGGVQALHYKAQDFRDATDADALNFEAPKFTPFINLSKQAAQAAKDAGFNISVDQIRGGYIVTTKNGQLLEQPLHEYFMGLFGSDPAVMEMFRTQAYLQRKTFISENTAKYGSSAAAEQAYINDTISRVVPAQAQAADESKELSNMMGAKKAAMDKKIQQNGLILGTPEHRSYADLMNQIQNVEATNAVFEQSNNLAESASNMSNMQSMRNRADDIVGFGLLSTQMDGLAKQLAYRDYEVKIKEDPYALESYKSNLAFKNALTLKQADFEYWKMKEDYKQNLADKQQLGTAEQNSMSPDNSAKGTTAKENVPTALDANTQKRDELTTAQGGDQRQFLKELATTLATEYSASVGHKTNGEDDGGTRQAMLKDTSYQTFGKTKSGLDFKKIVAGTEDLSKIDKMDDATVSKLYNAALQQANPSTPVTGSVNDFWNQSFWDKTQATRDAVKSRQVVLADFSKYYKDQSNNVIASMKKDYNNSEDNTLLQNRYDSFLTYLVDGNGRLVDKETFMNNYASTGWITELTDDQMVNGSLIVLDQQAQAGYRDPDAVWRAKRVAGEAYDDLVEKYNDTYLKIGKAYNAPPNLNGAAGSVVSGGAVRGQVDGNNTKARNTLYAADIFRNINSLDLSGNGGAYVRYGDADKKENSAGADAVLRQLMSDFNTQPVKGRKKPVFDMRYQTIAANDANYSAVTFFPSEEWAKKYKGSKSSPGLTYGDSYKSGITVLIPKDQDNSSLAEHSKYSDSQFLMEHGGKLEVKDYPQGGEVTLEKAGDNYVAKGFYITFDDYGNQIRNPVQQFYPMSLDPGAVYTNWTDQLKYYSGFNKTISQAISQQYGIKDPAKVPPPQQ